MEYNYIISKGHHLAEIEGRVFVIDTGSPMSFSLRENFSICINGILKDFRINRMLQPEQIEELVGCRLDGFIGLDLLKVLKTVVFDKDIMKVSFGSFIDRNEESVDTFNYHGYIGININVNGRDTNGVFDTGACLNYIDGGIQTDSIVEDFSPTFGGKIIAPVGSAVVQIGNRTLNLEFGDMSRIPKLAQARYYGMFLGSNNLFEHKLSINLEKDFMNID